MHKFFHGRKQGTADEAGSLCPRKVPHLLESPPLDGEVVVVDLAQNRSFTLNASLAEVWACCDGQTGLREAARRLSERFSVPLDEQTVILALRRLRRFGLIEDRPVEGDRSSRLTRRELAQKLRFALPGGLLLPVVTALAIQDPVWAASLPCIRDVVCAAGLGVCGQSCFASGSATKDCPTKACMFSQNGTGSISCRPRQTGGCFQSGQVVSGGQSSGGQSSAGSSSQKPPPFPFK